MLKLWNRTCYLSSSTNYTTKIEKAGINLQLADIVDLLNWKRNFAA